MVQAARLKREIVEMALISRVFKMHRSRRIIANEHFLKFRTQRLKEIARNLKKLAFQEFWKKRRTNFWILREKDRRARRFNKARHNTRSKRRDRSYT